MLRTRTFAAYMRRKFEHHWRRLRGDGNLMQLAKGSFASAMVKVVASAGGYVFMIFVVRTYDESVYGVLETGTTIMLITTMLAIMGLDGAIPRFVAEFRIAQRFKAIRDLLRNAMRRTVLLTSLYSAMLFLAAPWVAQFFHRPDITGVFRLMALLPMPYALSQIFASTFRGLKQMIPLGMLQSSFIPLPATLFALLLGYFSVGPAYHVVIAYGAGVLFLMLMGGYLLRGQLQKLGSGNEELQPFGDVTKVAYPMFLSSAMGMAMLWTDTIMIGYFRDMGEVGIYRITVKVAGLLTITQFAINSMLGPMLSEFNATRDYRAMRRVLRQIGLLNMGLSTPVFLALMIFPEVVLGFIGEDLNEGIHVLQIMTASQLVNVWSGPVMNVLNMTGREVPARTVIMIATILNIAINFALIPKFGYLGAGVATAVSMLTWNLGGVYLVWKYYRAWTLPLLGYLTPDAYPDDENL